MESAGDENHPSRKRITQLSNESEVVFVVSAQTAARPQLQTSAVYCCGQDCPSESCACSFRSSLTSPEKPSTNTAPVVCMKPSLQRLKQHGKLEPKGLGHLPTPLAQRLRTACCQAHALVGPLPCWRRCASRPCSSSRVCRTERAAPCWLQHACSQKAKPWPHFVPALAAAMLPNACSAAHFAVLNNGCVLDQLCFWTVQPHIEVLKVHGGA